MDPLSLVASVASASRIVSSVSTSLYKFIQDAKQVDDTVNVLFREVGNLQRMISAVDSILHQPSTQAVIKQDQDLELWESVDDSIMECRKTLRSLDVLLAGLDGKKVGQSAFGKSIKQVKVNWRSDDFNT